MTRLRVGIPLVGGKRWLGGVSFIESHVKALLSLPPGERPRLFLVLADDFQNDFTCYRPFAHIFDAIIYVCGNPHTPYDLTHPPLIPCASQDELFSKIDFYFPFCFNVMPNRPAISWIPDFQHKYLPDFFTPQEIAARDAWCRRIAEEARLVFCTSRAVERDFQRFYPFSPARTKVLVLRILPDATWYVGNPRAIQEKYALPPRFILCANQFWIHKNHRRLCEAIALLRQAGEDTHLVCTGLQHDCRQPGYFPALLQYIDELGIADLVHILGVIPRHDQIQLLRRSLFVVQPSLFEGLSLIVQESRALGKRLLLSDIDVFAEDTYSTTFRRKDPQDLARQISALSAISSPGPDREREEAAHIQATGLATAYAAEFCAFLREAQTIF